MSLVLPTLTSVPLTAPECAPIRALLDSAQAGTLTLHIHEGRLIAFDFKVNHKLEQSILILPKDQTGQVTMEVKGEALRPLTMLLRLTSS